MGSHSGEAGAWVSGPEDLSPPEYFWGYNKMTSIQGLFAAGDGVGAAPHKFSSGSFTEGQVGRQSGGALCAGPPRGPSAGPTRHRQLQQAIWAPLETFAAVQGASPPLRR